MKATAKTCASNNTAADTRQHDQNWVHCEQQPAPMQHVPHALLHTSTTSPPLCQHHSTPAGLTLVTTLCLSMHATPPLSLKYIPHLATATLIPLESSSHGLRVILHAARPAPCACWAHSSCNCVKAPGLSKGLCAAGAWHHTGDQTKAPNKATNMPSKSAQQVTTITT